MMKVSAKIVNNTKKINNLLFFCYNYIFKKDKVAKGIREFMCAGCGGHYTYPFTSKDYFMCNSCWKTL
jgi:hypothetical protein